MKIKVKTLLVFIITTILLIIAYNIIPSKRSQENDNDANTEMNYERLGEVVFNVKTELVKKGDLIKTISANGLVKAFKELEVVSNISGFISEVKVYEGKHVFKGDLLIKLDDRDYKIALNEAEASLLNAKIEYGFYAKEESVPIDTKKVDSIKVELNKLQKLFNDKKISEDEYLKEKDKLDLSLIFTGAKREDIILNKSGMTNAINAVNRAKLNLSYTEIFAPFSGVVANFNLVENKRVNAGEKLFDLLDVSRLKVEVGVLENEINKIKIGSKAELKLNAVPDKIYIGKVIQINPLVDPETKTCRVTVEIMNKDNSIKPGMFTSVSIEAEIFKNRILIPKEALLVRDRRNLVFIVENGLAKWHYVKIGEQNDKFIEVIDGINNGDTVIVDGHYNLAHDSKINIIQ
ncbi:MAG: efflux RND transporter periplasmic adaptor subunit [Ignavibacterium sp.]|uniref:efflux RND transporter periplasmic adaptor subunit n=1 Tax=Ignavibacterium sp. TaxID=2651167 RepID=UPI00404A8ED4